MTQPAGWGNCFGRWRPAPLASAFNSKYRQDTGISIACNCVLPGNDAFVAGRYSGGLHPSGPAKAFPRLLAACRLGVRLARWSHDLFAGLATEGLCAACCYRERLPRVPRITGVRPSPAAATSVVAGALEQEVRAGRASVAAAGDGRTPLQGGFAEPCSLLFFWSRWR